MVCLEDTIVMHVPIILAMEASVLLMKGWSGYFAYVMGHKKVPPTLEEIFVVKNFPKVFLKELNGLPP